MSRHEGAFFDDREGSLDDHSEPPLAEEPMAVTLDEGFSVQDLGDALDLGERMAQPQPPLDEEFWGGVR